MRLDEENAVPGSSRIKRCLFGSSDPDLVHNQYSKMIRDHLKQAENEWNFDFEDEAPTISEKARFKWERVRSKSVPPMYRSVRILSNSKTQPAGSMTKLTNNRPASVLSMKREGQVKVPPKHIRQKKIKKSHQRTITDFMVKNRAGRGENKLIKTEIPLGKTSPDRIFGVLTRSTSRVHTRSTARRHIVI